MLYGEKSNDHSVNIRQTLLNESTEKKLIGELLVIERSLLKPILSSFVFC